MHGPSAHEPALARPRSVFAVRRLGVVPVAAALVLHMLLSSLVNFRLFDSAWMHAIANASDGWLSGTLVANLGLLVAVVGGCLCAWGRARAADLGLHDRDILPAVLGTFAMWVLLQLALAFAVLATGEPFVASVVMRRPQLAISELAAQLGGNALYEEILFRGCVLVQFARWLVPRGCAPDRRAIVLAFVLSQLVFALQHVPNRLAFGSWHGFADAAGDLALLFFAGLCFAGVFVRTGNLLLAVGLHALGNVPLPLLEGPQWVQPAVFFAATMLLLVAGPRLRARAAA